MFSTAAANVLAGRNGGKGTFRMAMIQQQIGRSMREEDGEGKREEEGV